MNPPTPPRPPRLVPVKTIRPGEILVPPPTPPRSKRKPGTLRNALSQMKARSTKKRLKP